MPGFDLAAQHAAAIGLLTGRRERRDDVVGRLPVPQRCRLGRAQLRIARRAERRAERARRLLRCDGLHGGIDRRDVGLAALVE